MVITNHETEIIEELRRGKQLDVLYSYPDYLEIEQVAMGLARRGICRVYQHEEGGISLVRLKLPDFKC